VRATPDLLLPHKDKQSCILTAPKKDEGKATDICSALACFVLHFFGDGCLKCWFKDFPIEESEQIKETWDLKRKEIVSWASHILKALAHYHH
jgi:hypothetical protein